MRLIRGAGAGGRRKDRGGVHAFRAAVQTLREGRSVGMTADVPGSGEARRAGLGVVMMARQSGRPIMPLAIATSRYVALNTWSRMTINLPWSNLGFAVGEVVHVPRDATSRGPRGLSAGGGAIAQRGHGCWPMPVRAWIRAGRRRARIAAPGLRLKAYRTLTSLARPLAPAHPEAAPAPRQGGPGAAAGAAGPARARRGPPVRLAWFHAASVGETLSILPLISALAERRHSLSFLLTTGTVTSAKLAAQRLGPRTLHQYAPLDVPKYVRSFLDHWRPDLAVFTESEIWPNLILESSARGIPLTLVNARMTQRSYRRWRRNRGLARPLFSRFSLVLAQNEALARRFKSLGAATAVASGNLKIDTPPPPVDEPELERLKAALEGRPLLLAACTHEGEEAIVAEAHRQLRRRFPDLITIIAPRHPERGPAIAELAARRRGSPPCGARSGSCPRAPARSTWRTRWASLACSTSSPPSPSSAGRWSTAAGTTRSRPCATAPSSSPGRTGRTSRIPTRRCSTIGGAIVVRSAADLASAVEPLLANEAELARMRERAERALAGLSGALPRTVEALLRYLPGEDELARAD